MSEERKEETIGQKINRQMLWATVAATITGVALVVGFQAINRPCDYLKRVVSTHYESIQPRQ